MIISASRRTDIPSFYSEWFLNRIKEKFVYVRNPMNIHQISKISLKPDVVDCIVFWTKNPKPMLDKLELLKEYFYYFQFTLNPYEREIEPNLPFKDEIINTFKNLSDKIGPEKIIWRYDPILLNNKYSITYHIDNFEKLAGILKGYTEKIIFSFIDFYKRITENIRMINANKITIDEKNIVAEKFSQIARENNLSIDTCAEDIDFSKYGIAPARCIDDRLIAKITGYDLITEKDKSQRSVCGCVKSIDIGEYSSCSSGCIYCYANYSHNIVTKNVEKHYCLSPLLIGNINFDDIIKERAVTGNKAFQSELF
jgi:DNA repair photolyase